MKKNKKNIGAIDPATLGVIISTSIQLISNLLGRSPRQEEIQSINEESVILKPLAYQILDAFPAFKAKYQPIIDGIWKDTDQKKGKNKNPGESAINCVYREIIINAIPLLPELQKIAFLPRQIWSCTPQQDASLLPQVAPGQVAPGQVAPGQNSLSFKPNAITFALIAGVLYLLFGNKEFKIF